MAKYKLTIYENDDAVTYQSDDAAEIIKQLESIKEAEKKEKEANTSKPYVRPLSPYERTRASVYATGNKWAIENFEATH